MIEQNLPAKTFQLEKTGFAAEERVVVLGKKRLEQESIIDNTKGDLNIPSSINIEDYIVYASPLGNNVGSKKMERTNTDGRSVGALVGKITDNDGHTYCDFQVKGVGINQETPVIAEKNLTIENETDPDKRFIKPWKAVREYPLRFEERKVKGISGKLGFSAPIQVTVMEDDLSKQFSQAGMRTRRLAFAGSFSDEVPLSTAVGIQYAKDMEEQLGYRPGVEIWAIRSRYRVDDIFYHNRSTTRDLVAATSSFTNFTNQYELDSRPFHKRAKEKKTFAPNELETIQKDFSSLRGEIVKRCKLDEDPRFQALAILHDAQDLEKDTEKDITKEQTFWQNYLLAFSGILGEQVGIMYREGAYTKENLLNAQNVTLLAEIVDHDVTFIDKEKKKNATDTLAQFSQTLETLCRLISYLYLYNLLNGEVNVENLLETYAKGIINKISQEDKAVLHNILKEHLLTTVRKEIDSKSYKSLQESIQTLEKINPESDLLKTLQQRVLSYQEDLTWTLNEKDGWAPKKDVLGRSQLRFLADTIIQLTEPQPPDIQISNTEKPLAEEILPRTRSN